jgi:peptidoglycan/LPS O-acetylase OafA/YrhL
MAAEPITDFISAHIPELILLTGGIIALLIVYAYLKNDLSKTYKGLMAVGVLFGVLMIILCVSSYADWKMFPSVVIVITGFTLAIRPFREVHFAVIGALLVMVLAYLLLGSLAGTTGLEILAEGWPRVIAAFVIGAIVYMILHFAESIVKLFGKLFNWWPLLLILALICVIESILIFTGYGSLYDFVTGGK